MANNIWFPFYMGNYLAKTSHLSQNEHGAYLCLLLYYYSNKKPISHNRRYSICRAFAEQEQDACDVVLQEFFTREGDEWVNSRVEEELQRSENISEKRSQAAKTRYMQMQSKCSANAVQMDTQLQLQSQLHNTDTVKSEIVQQAAPQTKPTKENNRGQSGTSITTQLGDNPIIPAEWANFASTQFGWGQSRIDGTFEKFVDYWRGRAGAAGRKSDWLATWRNWCRSDAERSLRGASQNSGGVRSATAAAAGAVMVDRYGATLRGYANGGGQSGLADTEGGDTDFGF